MIMISSCFETGEESRDMGVGEKSNQGECSSSPAKIDQVFEKSNQVIQNIEEEQLDEEALKKKNESKQRYRRLKQKLTMLCYQHQEKCLIKENKEVSSPNKSRLLTLAIQFEKMTLNQTKDYPALESKLKQILKILDHKRQHDLLILKQSRFIPAISSVLKKVPTFHKNQFNQCLKTVELGLRLLRIFCTLSSNRDYMISTNQLVVLNSCLSSFIGKEEKKLTLECYSLLHELMCSRIKADSQQIVNVSLQIVFIGQLARKIRIGIEAAVNEDGATDEQFILKSLKYLFMLYKKCLDKELERPVYQQEDLPQIFQFHSDNLISLLQSILPKILLDEDGELRDEELPICIINISLYILKLLNLNLHVNLSSGQKIIEISQKNQFLKSIKILFQYSMDSMDNKDQLYELNCICSEIIEFLGKISCGSKENKRILAETSLLEKLYNHPVSYIMDPKLKSILIPSLCATMDGYEANMKKYLMESSADAITSYISSQKWMIEELQLKSHQENQMRDKMTEGKDEDQLSQISTKNNIGSTKTLTRKQSVSSLNSYTTECTQRSSMVPHEQEKYTPKLINLVPFEHWEPLMSSLKKLDG